MSYFRLLLIPVYLYVYFNARTDADYLKAALVIAVSGLTDALDGFIARHFDQITDWGKLIDPVADKLTLAAISISLALRFPLMGAVFALYLAKEGYMLVMGAVMLRRGYRMDGARWYGKVCTAVDPEGFRRLFLEGLENASGAPENPTAAMWLYDC